MRATVITDASYCDRSRAAGWAAWIRIDGQSEPIRRYGAFKTEVTGPTQAEMLAAINGVWLAHQMGATEVLLQTDCATVVMLAEGQVRRGKLRKAWAVAVDRAGLVNVSLSARHVRGHTKTQDARSYVNRWCDVNARAAMRHARRRTA